MQCAAHSTRAFSWVIKLRLISVFAISACIIDAHIDSTFVFGAEGPAQLDWVLKVDGLKFQERPEFVATDNNAADCGVRAAFLLMRLLGSQRSLSEVQATVPVRDDGTSLEALEKALNELGCTAMAVHVLPEDCGAIPCPAIVHLESRNKWRHYMLLLSAENGVVVLAEPTMLTVVKWPVNVFSQYATGYYIISRQTAPFTWGRVTLISVGASLVSLVVVRFLWLSRYRKSTTSAVIAICVVGTCTGCGTQARSTGHTASAEKSASLDIPITKMSLGAYARPQPVVYRFSFTNISDRDVTPTLLSTSCTCAEALIEPVGPLRPGDTGVCQMTLDLGASQKAGTVEASALLEISETRDTFAFDLSAGLEGMRCPAQYIIRTGDLGANDLLPLELTLFSSDPNERCRILSVNAFVTEITLADATHGTAIESTQPCKFLEGSSPLIDDTTSESVSDGLFRSRLLIPIRLTGAPSTSKGFFLIQYQSKDVEATEARVPWVLLTENN